MTKALQNHTRIPVSAQEAARYALAKIRHVVSGTRLTDFARGDKGQYYQTLLSNKVITLKGRKRGEGMVLLSAEQFRTVLDALKRQAGETVEPYADPLLTAMTARFDALMSDLESRGGAKAAMTHFKRGGNAALARSHRPGKTERPA